VPAFAFALVRGRGRRASADRAYQGDRTDRAYEVFKSLQTDLPAVGEHSQHLSTPGTLSTLKHL